MKALLIQVANFVLFQIKELCLHSIHLIVTLGYRFLYFWKSSKMLLRSDFAVLLSC